MKNLKQKGITLIALVVTIVVLLILAGVTIAMLTGENGIINQASKAGDKTNLSEEKEKVQLAVTGAYLEDGRQEIQETTLDEEVGKYFKNYSVESGEDDEGIEGYIVTVTDTGRRYFVDKNGSVTEMIKGPIAIHTISPEEQVEDGEKVTIILTVTATEGTITKITKPDGSSVVNTNTTTYEVTDNGTYSFKIEQSNRGVLNYKVKITNAKKQKILARDLEMGDLVYYDTGKSEYGDNGIIKCVVLYDWEYNSLYNKNYGVQLVPITYVQYIAFRRKK